MIGCRLHDFERSSLFQPAAVPGSDCHLSVVNWRHSQQLGLLILKRDLVGATQHLLHLFCAVVSPNPIQHCIPFFLLNNFLLVSSCVLLVLPQNLNSASEHNKVLLNPEPVILNVLLSSLY